MIKHLIQPNKQLNKQQNPQLNSELNTQQHQKLKLNLKTGSSTESATESTRWVALMIQLGKFVDGVGGWLADTNYLYPARWGWINKNIYLFASKKYVPIPSVFAQFLLGWAV